MSIGEKKLDEYKMTFLFGNNMRFNISDLWIDSSRKRGTIIFWVFLFLL